MIKAMKFVGVPVSDQDKALEFYTKKLGFRVITDQPMGPGQRWIEIGIGSNGTGLALFTPEGQEDRIGTFTGIAFTADDVPGTWKELTGKGVKFTQPPKKESWGTSSIFVDPDGNQFVLGSP